MSMTGDWSPRKTASWSRSGAPKLCYRTRGVPPNPEVCACRWSHGLIDINFSSMVISDQELYKTLEGLIRLIP